MKPSFILHKDSLCVLEDLTNEQRGELFYAIYCYQIGEVIELSPIVKIAFSQFRNQFVRDEEKFKKTVKARQEAGSKGGKQRVANQANASTTKQSQANQAVSDSVNESVSVNDSKKEIIINNQEAISIATFLFDSIKHKNNSFKTPNINQWAKDIDLAMRLDGRTEQELIDCIRWIYTEQGAFWQKNILSGKKLRDKFDQMNMQVITKQPTKKEKAMNNLDMLKANAMRKDGYSDEQIMEAIAK